ncbi:MAG: hypothetical protein HYX93_01540, partial [Chloroflexi bacterium]|nr:hypothetical protein [Chloroflexota bacterium]
MSTVQARNLASIKPAESMTISLGDILPISNPKQFKLHLACRSTDFVQPLDEYVADSVKWDGWNAWRGRKNDWTRPYILSFMEFYHRRDTWLFGGAFEVLERGVNRYKLSSLSDFQKYKGRLLASFHRYQGMRGRAYFLEKYLKDFKVAEVLPHRYTGESFSGFENIDHEFSTLE